MKEIERGFVKIFKEEKTLLLLMVATLVAGIFLGLHTLFNLKTNVPSMYVGYSDIGEFSGGDFLSLWNSGGYRTGNWGEMMAFPLLGLLIGVLHNFFAIQVFNRRGKGYAQIFLLLSLIVLVGAFLVLMRLLGEI